MSSTSHDDLPFDDERVTAYLDDELSPTERAAFEAELQTNPALQAELDALSSAQAFLSDHGSLAAPAGLLDDILAAAAEENVVSIAWYRRPFGIPLEGLAVAAAALLVVYVALPGGPAESVSPTEVAAGRAAPPRLPVKSAPLNASDAKPKGYLANQEDGVAAVDLDPEQQALAEKKVWNEKASQNEGKAEASVDRAKGVADFEVPEVGDKSIAKDVAVEGEKLAEGIESAKPLFSQVPYSYSIATTDPAVLAQLAALAARYNGQLKGEGAKALAIEELSGSDAATVMVKIPSHALRDFGRSLEALGVVRAQSDNSMFAGDPVEVRVSVQLVNGSGTAAPSKKAAPNTSKKILENLK